jgi:RNA polymerase sigma factor (sigma-70 family)
MPFRAIRFKRIASDQFRHPGLRPKATPAAAVQDRRPTLQVRNFSRSCAVSPPTRVEVSALKHAGPAGLHGRSPLLRLQSDERLVALTRRGSHGAFEALVSRYQSRLLAFCRHMLASREDAEDVLQEVFTAAFNAMVADERPINVRPWLYRIARNRCLNHLRRTPAIGVDSMDVHLSENGLTTADQVHRREEFRLLVGDVQELPESQRTALLLREIDALSYEQIAEAMETTIPSVKSLLVRARVGLTEAAEARQLSCDEVREELGEVAEGLRRTSAPARRHVRGCDRCANFKRQLRHTNKALAALYPVAPLLLLKKTLLAHLGTTAAAGGSSAAAGGSAAAAGAAAGGALQAGIGAVASKAVAGLAAAAIVTAGAVEVKHVAGDKRKSSKPAVAAVAPVVPASIVPEAVAATQQPAVVKPAKEHAAKEKTEPAATATATPEAAPEETPAPVEDEGRIQHDGDTTMLPPQQDGSEPTTTMQQPAPTSEPAPTQEPARAPADAEPEPAPSEQPPAEDGTTGPPPVEPTATPVPPPAP